MNAGHWRGWVVATAIFVLGVAVGAAGMTWVGIRRIRHALAAPASAYGAADRTAARIGANLTDALALTPEQSARMQASLDRAAVRMKGVRVRAALQARVELRAALDEIAQELPPEKRAEFRRLVARRYERLGLMPPEADGP
jgi:hypothetical protein